MALEGLAKGYVTYQDVKHIASSPTDMNYALIFNGSDTYATIPVSLTDKTDWSVEIELTSTETGSNSAIYRQPCIFGVDTAGYLSRDLHVDISKGCLYLFSGLGGSNDVSQLNTVATLDTGGGDYGWQTNKVINDGAIHTIKLVLKDNKVTLYLDGENLGYLNVTKTISHPQVYLGCSRTGECVYCKFNLYSFSLNVAGTQVVHYELGADGTVALKDKSGNGNDATLTGNFKTDETKIYIDYSLPVGAGGIANAYATYNEHDGFDVRNLDVYFTYKQDDKVNLWEGTDATISGIAGADVTYRPHDGLDIRKVEGTVNYRPHDGLDIRKLDLYFLYKQEDKVDSFKIPFGIGGYTSVYILERLHSLVGFLNDYGIEKIAGIVLGSDYYPLKNIQSFNDIPFFNNTTEDDNTTEGGG